MWRGLVFALAGGCFAAACANDYTSLSMGPGDAGIATGGAGAGSGDGSGATGTGGDPSNTTTSAGGSAAGPGGGGDGGSAGSGAAGGAGTGGVGVGGDGGSGGGGAGQGGQGGQPPVGVTCDEQYNAVDGYVPCPAAAGECRFNLDAGGQTSCESECAAHGGECLDAIDNEEACTIANGGRADCADDNWGSVWCVCSHGCGGGPPCPAGEQCQGGVCS